MFVKFYKNCTQPLYGIFLKNYVKFFIVMPCKKFITFYKIAQKPHYKKIILQNLIIVYKPVTLTKISHLHRFCTLTEVW